MPPSAELPVPFVIRMAECGHGAPPREVDIATVREAQGAIDGLRWAHILVRDVVAARAMLIEQLGLDPLEVEDALSEGDRANVIPEPNRLFVTLPVPCQEGDAEVFHELALFAGRSFLLSVARAPLPSVDAVFERWAINSTLARQTVGETIYTIVDTVVDAYFPVSDRIQDEIDELEEGVFDADRPIQIRDALQLKRRLLQFRRRVTPVRDAVNSLLRRDLDLIEPGLTPLLHDSYDQALRLVEIVDIDRDILASILDAHLSVVSNRINEVMRVMTVAATVLMSVTLVASIYGMNFKRMPELNAPWGYPAALGTMALIAAIELYLFKRKDWI